MVWVSQHESTSVTPEVILRIPGTSRVYTDVENVAAAAKLRVLRHVIRAADQATSH
jgi:hypothetical protein